MALVLRPDRLFVQVQRLFSIDGNGRRRGGAVPDDPCLAIDQIIENAIFVSYQVWPGTRPLIGVLALQPVRSVTDKPAYLRRIPRHAKT